jgi:undecaprenyl-diphosphatase
MTTVEAMLLGFFQGVTEFLPISSSGHLVLTETYLNFQPSEFLFFDLILHIATLLAVCVFFYRRILEVASRSVAYMTVKESRAETRGDFHLVLAIGLSTLVTGGVGIPFKDVLEQMRDNLAVVGICFILTGVLLLSTRLRQTSRDPEVCLYPPNIWLFAVIVGLGQAVAIAPGISRSGTTVAIALLLGATKPKAIEYSFLMSIPAILGATVLNLRDAEILVGLSPIVAGFMTAMVSGVLFLWLLVWIVNKGKFHQFAYYTIPLGLFVLWLSFGG